jgi:hypothetical protein
MTDFIYEQNQRAISQLREHYQSHQWEDVERFLAQQPIFTAYLEDAYPHLKRIFAPDVRATCRIFTEPEDESEKLIVSVGIKAHVHEAMEKLDQFKDEWYLPRMSQLFPLVVFHLDSDELYLD